MGRKSLTGILDVIQDVPDSSANTSSNLDDALDFSNFESIRTDKVENKAAIDAARKAGFVKQQSGVRVGRPNSDMRQGNPKVIQFRSYEVQEAHIEDLMHRFHLKSKKETLDALIAATLHWVDQGNVLSDGMMHDFLNDNSKNNGYNDS